MNHSELAPRPDAEVAAMLIVDDDPQVREGRAAGRSRRRGGEARHSWPVLLAADTLSDPARTAMVALTVFDIMDSVDAASTKRVRP